ncbi:TetR/AcrR family transcriptional regulator [Pseudogracilibacillus sp. SO30301A]|uniref:TetR/AcrR family transcriptional regulator n=1 Tax=Pseudogracilibacillus sp. SO30301A TaxID=3098291 RepID=UPI00300E3691
MDERKINVILTAKKVFSTKGYQASSVQDIFEACNISKGTFYNYFSSKNDFLISYMDLAREEEFTRRESMLDKHDRSNKDIFIKQVLVRVEIMNEFTLLPIYEAAFHSDDVDLKGYINKRLIEELSWLADRLGDIYGDKAMPYVSDCAVLMHGMVQNMHFAWETITKKKINLTMLIQYVVRRIDTIIEDLIESKEIFLNESEYPFFKANLKNETKQTLLSQLYKLISTLDTNNPALKEYIEFVIEEVQLRKPRIHLLSSMEEVINTEAANTKYEKSIHHISLQLNKFINEKNCSPS